MAEYKYNMENYAILDNENVPILFKNKPRWVFFVLTALGVLLLMLFSVAIGILIAYVHCYIEHRGKHSQATNVQISRTFTQNPNNTQKTINEAIASNVIVSWIFEIGRSLIEDGHDFLNSHIADSSNKTDDLKIFL